MDSSLFQGTRGVIWEHEVYEPFVYNQDRSYFHTFAGDVGAHSVLPLAEFAEYLLGMHDRFCLRRRK